MPRRARIKCSGISHHLILQGNNRLACFFLGADYQFYLVSLLEGARRYSCDVHAYVLMTNHVHLLVTPGEEKDLSYLMRYLLYPLSSLSLVRSIPKSIYYRYKV